MTLKPTIQYADFAKLDIRVGTVMAAESPDWSEKLLKFTVFFGHDIGEKTILAGIKAWYPPEHFTGKNFLFVINLAERKMGPDVSQGMMLMIDEPTKPRVFEVSDLAQPGMPIA
ncbi:MAG TPA: hypothetical protein DEP87_02190 [Candidatus Pacebacteria bacterium]|nr:hypothetical protein [Candidatus Paceibacterota bacterium]